MEVSQTNTQTSVPGDSTKYDNTYILPGIFEMHTHLPPDNPLNLTPYFSLLFLSYGVTSVREAGDIDGTAVEAYLRDITRGSNPGLGSILVVHFLVKPTRSGRVLSF